MDAQPIEILLVEDDPTDVLLLRTSLEGAHSFAFELTRVERLGEALDQLAGRHFSVVLLDMNLPDSSGLEGLTRLRAVARDVPILLLTGLDDETVAIAAVQHGAQDYLVKGKSEPQHLCRAIRYAIERKRSEELQRAKEAAERSEAAALEASRAKDHFLAVLSHELRTPLTPLLATAAMLEHDPGLPERFRQDMAVIRRNVELEARLIDDLLDVTRISRGKLELHRQPADLRQVLREAVDVCRGEIEAKQIQFGTCADDGPPCIVHGDPTRLQQVFWNLLNNSIKFTPPDGCIGVSCELSAGRAIVEVSDSGEGIDPAVLPRIFNAFEQGGSGMTRQFGGLGLGLAITRGLVELHGGTISAQSPGKGQGAVFRVSLPLAAPEVRLVPVADEGDDGKHRRKFHILLVEDHADTARIMSRLLSARGHTVQTAGDVRTALALADAEGFDLLISDLGLPDASGIELMRTLRERGRTLPGIALSGYGQEQDIQRSREAGFAIHLTKPTSPDRLAQAIAAVAEFGPPSK